MGNEDNDNLISLLGQRNTEIQRLNAEILAYSARTSNLQTRLLQTFDALDETQRAHARELEEVERKYGRLERRFQRHVAILNACETERGELRESVLELVEKVEQSNDIRSWPVNRLQLTRFTEHLHQSETIKQQPIDEKLAYAGAIIDKLRRERDNEREAHASITEALQSRIDLLVTQLARRDAELEYYATRTTRSQTPAFLTGRDAGIVVSSPVQNRLNPNEAKGTGLQFQAGREGEEELGPTTARGITNEEIISMLSTTAARNRSLEEEIKTLFKRLEQARSRSTSSPLASTSKAGSRLGSAFTPPAKDGIVADYTSENWYRDVPDESEEYEGGDRVEDARQRHSHVRPPFTKGLSRTKTLPRPVTSSNQNVHVVNSSLGLDPGLRNPRKGRVKRDTYGENEEFNRERHQNMGSPIRGHQSTPVSESIDDDNLDNDDGGGVDIDLKTRARADGQSPPMAWDDSSPGFSDLEGTGDNYGHPQASASPRGSVARPKSATLTGLDEQIQDLAIQIDSFRRERETLLEFVAAQKQHQHQQWDKEGDPGVILGPCSSEVSRVGDDRSDGGGPVAAVEENTADRHGDDQDGDSPIEAARKDALDIFAHRLSVVEHECSQLRHELNECRLESEARENELLDEIRQLQRRVEELDVQFRLQQSYPQEPSMGGFPYSSPKRHSGASQPNPEQEQEDQQQQQSLQVESVSPLYLTPALVPSTAAEDNHIRTVTSPDITALVTTELSQPSSRVAIAEPPPIHTQFPWVQLNDSELDGLLDAIDGEASMELATPLMPTSLLDREGEDSRVHFESDDGPVYRDQEDDRDQDHSEELMIWDGLDERLINNSQSRSGYEYENDDDGGEVSEGGSRSESRGEEAVYSDDMAEREHREGQQVPPGVLGHRSWMMHGDDDSANVDELPEPLTRAQLEQEENEEEWGDADDDGREDYPDGRHSTHGREDPHNAHLLQQEQQEVLEVDYTGSPTRNTRFGGLGAEFIFPHSPATFSTTHPDSGLNSRSPSPSPSPSVTSPTETTERLRRELERAERELTVAQEMLEQGEDALRDVEATIRMSSSFSSPSSER